jgi:hypothetical protein
MSECGLEGYRQVVLACAWVNGGFICHKLSRSLRRNVGAASNETIMEGDGDGRVLGSAYVSYSRHNTSLLPSASVEDGAVLTSDLVPLYSAHDLRIAAN